MGRRVPADSQPKRATSVAFIVIFAALSALSLLAQVRGGPLILNHIWGPHGDIAALILPGIVLAALLNLAARRWRSDLSRANVLLPVILTAAAALTFDPLHALPAIARPLVIVPLLGANLALCTRIFVQRRLPGDAISVPVAADLLSLAVDNIPGGAWYAGVFFRWVS